MSGSNRMTCRIDHRVSILYQLIPGVYSKVKRSVWRTKLYRCLLSQNIPTLIIWTPLKTALSNNLCSFTCANHFFNWPHVSDVKNETFPVSLSVAFTSLWTTCWSRLTPLDCEFLRAKRWSCFPRRSKGFELRLTGSLSAPPTESNSS